MSAARLTALAVALLLVPSLPPAFAQNTAALNTKAEKLQTEYVRGAVDLATEYEKAGDPGAAMALLETVKKVVPDNAALEAKLKELQNDVLSAGETVLTIDASTEWQPVAQVREGAAFRLAAAGSYRISMTGSSTVDGLPPGDVAAGLISDAPLGALIGAYVDPNAAAAAARGGRTGNRGNEKDKPKVFTLGAGGEIERTADETGLLMVRLNLPVGARPTGKLKVMMSGQITPASGR
ncbi:hypothetical protein [Alienimonas californiensis]|uniref:Uncharacterized protein n=1 Tax=Alienimonas californiensis TaxID=2527989 RepID=A0A517P3X5_9PLAN|nr:hypothetical protein [Alienimonas californiensis]QDT14053.1 hypothetical protein CA12_01210 [Alienimonas californiensis]